MSRAAIALGLAVFGIVAASGGCSEDKAGMRAAVQDFGFTEVTLGGFAWLGCSKDDMFSRTWVGLSASGSRVEGVVCGGWAKGYTVRITGRAEEETPR
nr:hypothetical protein [Novosphingobium panipatense]